MWCWSERELIVEGTERAGKRGSFERQSVPRLNIRWVCLVALIWGVATAATAQIETDTIQSSIDPEEYPSMVNTRPVTLVEFPTAETHHMMQVALETLGDIGEWAHFRQLTPIDEQNVVRMNRDTLYSSLVLDLTTPATLTMPDIGERYQSLLVVNEGHFARKVIYDPGEHELTQEDMGTRYVAVIARTLVDADDPEDLAKAHSAQDGLAVSQADAGSFEVPNWDQGALEEMRDALRTLGRFLPNRDQAFGASLEKVDHMAFLISSADAWGGWQPEHAVYLNRTPAQNDGDTPHTLTLADVPAGESAFWSLSVYNSDGFFEANDYDRYVVNSRSAEKNEDGSVTIHFGGDPSAANFLPIMEGWNYMIRIYLPQAPYFDGSWTAPFATPVD